jgi:SAM-dependent methyltransferase
MAYLRKFKYDIFISYAHVDNRPHLEGHDGWVDQFYKSLCIGLSQVFGPNDQVSIWRDRRLTGTAILDPSIIDVCRSSAILVCITSPGYLASEWCQREYNEFRSANKDQYPLRLGNSSRILNVKLHEIFSDLHKTIYKEKFGGWLSYEFYNSDAEEGWSNPIWPGLNTDPEHRYEKLINRLARNIYNLLELMREATGQETDFGRTHKDIKTETISKQSRESFAVLYHDSLGEILPQAKEHIIISANTIDRFSDDDKVRSALISLVSKRVKVTIIMLNPNSASARAHAPYYFLESSGTSEAHYNKAFELLSGLFESLENDSKDRLEVLLSNYMPKFRTIVVDKELIYLYLYMYGKDVNDYPDFALEKRDPIAARIIESMYNLRDTPEIIPYIRDGKIYKYWERGKLAQWDNWAPEVRYRHRITHRYYVSYAGAFHDRFGYLLENYVQEHLNLLSGRAIILGCGSGKEVQYLAEGKKCYELYGVDFSPEAIKLAISLKQEKYPDLDAQFIVADFYDLEYVVEGEFDSIVANAAFVHLFDRADMSEMLRCIWRKLKPGGLCLIRNLYKEEDGTLIEQEYDKSTDAYGERWFVYYSRCYLAQLAKDAGFSVKDDETRRIGATFGGSELDVVMNKGFRHMKHYTVYWPTILLEKPCENKVDISNKTKDIPVVT